MKKKEFEIYVLITIVFFGILIKMEYATDTYSVFNFNSEQIYWQYASSGRFITAIVGKLIKAINLSEYAIYLGSYIIAIICAIISQYKLYTIIEKNVKSKALKLIIPTLIIINPFSIELFLYIEKGIMWFGILMCIMALENTKKYLEASNNMLKIKYIFFAILFMFFANCSYQGIIGIFISISLVYILKYSQNLKHFFINNIIVGIIYGIPTITNYLLMKILFKQSRVSGQVVLLESIQKVYLKTIEMLINMYNILPKYVFIFLILFTFGVFCSKIFKEKGRVLHFLKFLYIVAGVALVTIAPQFAQCTSSIWLVPRTTYSFASLYGILLLYLAINFELKEIEKILILVISCILILLQLQKFIQIENSRFELNKKDEQITMQIIDRIKDYELQTNNQICELSVYQDQKPNYTYSGIFATGDINVKCYANEWSTVSILNYYLKRELKLIPKDENISKEISKKNWDNFDQEQIKFEKDKLIICNY